jgi:C_GCAxxG_C_C family probable redox protein
MRVSAQPARALALARTAYLDAAHHYGCAESVLVALKDAYDLPNAGDSSAVMALNGGVAYSGGPCGAITGGAVALGLLAGIRVPDHREAKRIARELTAALMDEFQAAHGATSCRQLIGYDLRGPGGHQAFLDSGVWRDTCLRQIEFVVGRLAVLSEPATWAAAVAALEPPD